MSKIENFECSQCKKDLIRMSVFEVIQHYEKHFIEYSRYQDKILEQLESIKRKLGIAE